MDEALLDLTGDVIPDWEQHLPQHAGSVLPLASAFVKQIREQVHACIGIAASAGIAHSVLLARICTRLAKPDGQQCIDMTNIQEFLDPMPVSNLAGVGWSVAGRLRAMHVTTCKELSALSLGNLKAEFGENKGLALYNACRGLDSAVLKDNAPPKSVSVEITWGVRFNQMSQVLTFVENLAEEVSKRLHAVQHTAQRVTLKIKQKKADANMPYKLLGHGPCDDRNKTRQFAEPIDDVTMIKATCVELAVLLDVPPSEVRGVGISIHGLAPRRVGEHVSKLEKYFKRSSASECQAEAQSNSSLSGAARGEDKQRTSPKRAKKTKQDPVKVLTRC